MREDGGKWGWRERNRELTLNAICQSSLYSFRQYSTVVCKLAGSLFLMIQMHVPWIMWGGGSFSV